MPNANRGNDADSGFGTDVTTELFSKRPGIQASFPKMSENGTGQQETLVLFIMS
jgi:hypothetical protein